MIIIKNSRALMHYFQSNVLVKIKNIVIQMAELANCFLKECSKGEQSNHQELLALYYEVKESLSIQNALFLVEPADNEVIFKSDKELKLHVNISDC